ncbi:protein of unknown function [Candidatus Hydrogenisulfobacillus filiaventi]|uniref:Uncharacterized protein n=1 Tax=Candidatus Hydrogenisulfobacillus filiaventi TaxID=2707344 RepID=A0A6F8ZL60_9FIRM|nr:protein of unknown function [Candidatus Hydrogenisulfobacillus filiaventi]
MWGRARWPPGPGGRNGVLLPVGRGNRRQEGEARSREEAPADFARRGRGYLTLPSPGGMSCTCPSRMSWGPYPRLRQTES